MKFWKYVEEFEAGDDQVSHHIVLDGEKTIYDRVYIANVTSKNPQTHGKLLAVAPKLLYLLQLARDYVEESAQTEVYELSKNIAIKHLAAIDELIKGL